jgi:electron transport complex protein RnfG
MSEKKNGYVVPVIVLTVICLVVSGILAAVNSKAAPIIEQAAIVAAEEARAEVLPTADSFRQITDLTGMPDSVQELYVAENGAGTVAILTGSGYGGTMKIIVGINADGTIAGTQVLDHSETAGLGARVEKEPFRSQFVGQDSSLADVSVISGSTVSSKCFIQMVNEAFQAAELVAGKGE